MPCNWSGKRWLTTTLITGLFCVGAPALAQNSVVEPSTEAFFESKIRPILADTCFRCHGGQKTAGKLRVDTREALLKGGENGPSVEPGHADESLLINAILRKDGVSAMPPDKPLRPDQVQALRQWVKAGAPWPKKTPAFISDKHWAFQPLKSVPLPKVKDERWALTSVDAFIQAKLEAAKVTPAPRADRRTLIRRATYDLTGLPPSPEEVVAFEQDQRPDAYAKLVERLLSTPQYGEQWGRHWLDIVRYADTAGENTDHPLPHAWRYRNWVIQAFNRDLPFNTFIRDQIAGDLVPEKDAGSPYSDRVVATGYLAIARRFGHDIDKDIHLTYEDTIDTLGKSVLGLTIGCARCHDHKYDPISSLDYYSLYGILESTKFAFPGCEPKQQPRDLVPLIPPEEVARRTKEIRVQTDGLDVEIKRLSESSLPRARTLKSQAEKVAKTLSEGAVAEGASLGLETGSKSKLKEIKIRKGEVIQLSILPLKSHGADTTRVDLEIKERGGAGRSWKTADLVKSLPASNPNNGPAGSTPTWCFLDLKDGFQFLPERLDAIDGRAELKAWRNGDTPSVFVNSTDQAVKVWTTLPARSFFMHPGQSGGVALAWLSPIDGTIEISGSIRDEHPSGTDGVGWLLQHFQATDIASQYVENGSVASKLIALNKRRSQVATELEIPVCFAVAEALPKNTRMQKRGDPMNLGNEVPRKNLELLGGQKLKNPQQSGRLELAEWLTSPENPLTARVIVNRVWHWHFGRGLVTTPNDFGNRGATPTHPELLDYLTREFIKQGWSIKWLHREIMLSATYQLSSDKDSMGNSAASYALYDRFLRRRLSAEELRDTLLFVTGQIDLTPGQAHPFPPTSGWSFTQHNPFAAEYEIKNRSVYVMQKRNRRGQFYSLFDGPDPNASTPVRDVTTVPTQALFFLNDASVHAYAGALAAQTARLSLREGLEYTYRKLFGRSPTESEIADAVEFDRDYQAGLSKLAQADRERVARTAYIRVLLESNELLYID